MTTRKTKKRKTRRRSKRTKEESKLNKLKKIHDQLYIKVAENVQLLMKQTGMKFEDFERFVKVNGYEKLKALPKIQIAEPILDRMIAEFKQFDKVDVLVERLEKAQNKMFIKEIEHETVEMETKLREIEKEDRYYTTVKDKDGMVQLKEKWQTEMDYLKEELAHLEAQLPPQEEDSLKDKLLSTFKKEEPKTELERKIYEVKTKISKLNKIKKQNYMRNAPAWLGKKVNSFGKQINEIMPQQQEAPAGQSRKRKTSKTRSKSSDFGFGMDNSNLPDYESMFMDKKSKKNDWGNFFG